MLNIFCHQSPQEVVAYWISLFVLYPATLLQGSLDIIITSLDYEHFCVSINSILLSPLCDVSDVELASLDLSLVSLEEVVKRLVVLRGWLGLTRVRAYHGHFLVFVTIPILLQPAVLLIAQRGHILDILSSLKCFCPSLILQFLLSIELGLLLLILLRNLISDYSKLFLLASTDGLCSGLLISCLLEDFFLSFLIELHLRFSSHNHSLYFSLLVRGCVVGAASGETAGWPVCRCIERSPFRGTTTRRCSCGTTRTYLSLLLVAWRGCYCCAIVVGLISFGQGGQIWDASTSTKLPLSCGGG